MKEIAGCGVREGSRIAFAIASHTLAEGWIVIFRLGYSGVESGANECYRFEIILNEKVEFFGGIKLTQFLAFTVMGYVNSLDLQLAREIGHGLAERAVVIVRRK